MSEASRFFKLPYSTICTWQKLTKVKKSSKETETLRAKTGSDTSPPSSSKYCKELVDEVIEYLEVSFLILHRRK